MSAPLSTRANTWALASRIRSFRLVRIRLRGRCCLRTAILYHHPTMEDLTTIDIFAGAGGLSLGFEQAGFLPALGVDSDERAMAAYSVNFPNANTHIGDVSSLTGGDLLQAAGTGSCSVVIGGPPCGAFSFGGLRRKDDDRRELVSEFGRLVREVAPRSFVMENVPGVLSPGARAIINQFRSEMEEGQYDVADPWVLDAADFGVPQRRRRVFIVGVRRGLPIPNQPTVSGAPPPTASDAIRDLENLHPPESSPNGEPTCLLGQASPYAARLRGEALDHTDLASQRPSAGFLTGCGHVNHSPSVQERFGAVLPGTPDPISRFFRLHPDRVAPTIRAGTLPPAGSHTAPRPIHYAFPRCITAREAARLQSLPDWFHVDHTKWRGFMQIGNAVPPLLGRAVAAAIKRSLSTGEAHSDA